MTLKQRYNAYLRKKAKNRLPKLEQQFDDLRTRLNTVTLMVKELQGEQMQRHWNEAARQAAGLDD